MSKDEQTQNEIMSLWDERAVQKEARELKRSKSEKWWKIINFSLLFTVTIGAAYVIYFFGFRSQEVVPMSDREIIGQFGPVGPGVEGGAYYFKFNQAIYWVEPAPSGKLRKIEGADLATFQYINKHYQIDRDHVYFQGEIIENADPQTFIPLAWPYAKDKGRVYFHSIKELSEADPATFEILDGGYQRDKNYVYFQRKIIKDADPATFEVWGNASAKDKNNFYKRDSIVGSASP